jgi:hypothetical protein
MTIPSDPIADMVRAYAGQQIPGGCDRCDAYQTVIPDGLGPNAHLLRVHHDDWCPALAAHQGRTPNRAERRAQARRRG